MINTITDLFPEVIEAYTSKIESYEEDIKIIEQDEAVEKEMRIAEKQMKTATQKMDEGQTERDGRVWFQTMKEKRTEKGTPIALNYLFTIRFFSVNLRLTNTTVDKKGTKGKKNMMNKPRTVNYFTLVI
jgi:hypothetical protein